MLEFSQTKAIADWLAGREQVRRPADLDEPWRTAFGRVEPLDDLDMAELWPGWIPLGMISLLGAPPGAGKSLLALDLARRIFHGAAIPSAVVGAEGEVWDLSKNGRSETCREQREGEVWGLGTNGRSETWWARRGGEVWV